MLLLGRGDGAGTSRKHRRRRGGGRRRCCSTATAVSGLLLLLWLLPLLRRLEEAVEALPVPVPEPVHEVGRVREPLTRRQAVLHEARLDDGHLLVRPARQLLVRQLPDLGVRQVLAQDVGDPGRWRDFGR